MIFLKQLKRQRRNRSFVGAVIPQGELQGIMACCNPTPPLVHQQINALHQLLLYSRKSMTPKRTPQPTLFGPLDTSRSSESDFLDPSYFSIEQQQKEVQEKRQAKEQAKKAQESLQNVHTVRQQVMEAKQAGQKRARAVSDAGEESLKPNINVSKTESETLVADQSAKPAQKKQKKKNVQDPEVPEQNFKPFDYSQSNFKIFAGKLNESSQFDPNRQAHGPKQKKNQKGQKKSVVGGRSMSYVPAKSDRGFRPQLAQEIEVFTPF